MSSEFGRGSEVPGISEVRDVDKGWLLQPGSSRILSANVTWVLRDVTQYYKSILTHAIVEVNFTLTHWTIGAKPGQGGENIDAYMPELYSMCV